MRLFVAVFPPQDALAHLAATLSTMDAKTTGHDRLHITLAFMGEVADEAPALAALDGAQRFPVGELAISGGGRFGTVLWAGITGDVDGLARLTRSVRRSLRAKRVPPDDKRFHPHITIARRLSPGQIGAAMPILRAYTGPSWPVTELVLVRSELGPRPIHHRLRAWPLSG